MSTIKRTRGPAENPLGRSKLGDAAQSPGCKADETRGEGAYVRLRDRSEGEDNAADGVFGRVSRQGHPCFDKLAHFRVGRLHLPVAPKCNVKCNYCRRAINASEDRPGVCAKVISPHQALELTRKVLSTDQTIQVIGVAGPGDALANEETFKALDLIHKEFPHLSKCVSTNGLLLSDRLPDLMAVGVGSVSVTVNAVDNLIGRHFYKKAHYDGKTYDQDAFKVLSQNQLAGIKAAAECGVAVKINAVLAPELNGDHLLEVARVTAKLGAALMNIMPLKPLSHMADYAAPDCMELETARNRCESVLPQFRLCQQCRADAIGIPGQPHSDLDAPLYH